MAVSSHGERARGKLPRGPHQLTADQVAADQRQRLINSMVEIVGENGFAATTVADVIARAKVSRKTFYAHFHEREDLLLTAFDTVAPAAFDDVQAASKRKGGPTRQIEALMRRPCRIARASPNTIALSTIEIAAIDPAGVERRDWLIGDYGKLIAECLRTEDKSVLSPVLTRALAGGTHRTIDAYLRAGRADELPALATELARWTRKLPPHARGLLLKRTRANERDWHSGVSHTVKVLLEFLASEPYFTRMAFVDAPLAGPALMRRTQEHAGAYARLLLDGAPQRRRPPAIAAEATIHGLFELAFHHAAQHKIPELPLITREATYLALAPFVGVTKAAAAVA
jgi:TetR/AcrR family transcriptional regulator